MKNDLKQIFIKTIPVMTGYLVLGMGYGIYSASMGFGAGWVFPISLFVYAGSLQFVLVDLLHTGASFLTTALTSLMVNARHLFYGISMIDRYKDMGKVKPYLITSLTDETYSLVCQGVPEGISPKRYYFFISLFDQLYWITGSVLGALIGTHVSFNSAGIEFAMTALFITVVIDQWVQTKNHLPTLIGFGLSLVCLIIFGPTSFLVPTMIGITLVLLSTRKYNEARLDHE